MPWLEVIWIYGPGGNVEHIAENDVTPEEAEHVLRNAESKDSSDSSRRPIAFGFTRTGRELGVVFEWVDEITVYPVTAFEL
jgi:hypothetical protein